MDIVDYKIDDENVDKLDSKIVNVIESVLKEYQVRLWKMEVSGSSFYFVLDKEDGLSSILLQKVHMELFRMLEAVFPLDELGSIECVTPGVERELTEFKHWYWSIGMKVKVRFINKMGEKPITLEGILEYKDENFYVDGALVEIKEVKKAKNIFNYEEEMSVGNKAKKLAKKEAIEAKKTRKKLKDKKNRT